MSVLEAAKVVNATERGRFARYLGGVFGNGQREFHEPYVAIRPDQRR